MRGLVRHIHFVGIGGIGMSGLAEILLIQGFTVSGSDLVHSPILDTLRAHGATIFIGHDPDHIGDADVVVYSSAVDPATNPEVVAARQRRIPTIRRAEMLAEISRLKYAIAVAGTHGKTTTTSMIGLVLLSAGLDPTVIVGGRLRNFGNTNARLGSGDWIVVEADEYDRSFLQLSPTIAVITNIEEEHVDIYPSRQSLLTAFASFAQRVPFYGSVIGCVDDPGVSEVLPQVARKVQTYGTVPHSDVRAVGVKWLSSGMQFDVVVDQQHWGTIRLQVPGVHNVLNALAAVSVAVALDLDPKQVCEALAQYRGVARRLEYRGAFRSAPVYDDYAHHPTEVRVTLQTLRQLFPRYRILCVFQPHTFTRTQRFYREFARSLMEADVALVLDIYPAREKPIDGVHSRLVCDTARQLGHQQITYCPSWDYAYEQINRWVDAETVVVTVGAGSIWKFAEQLVRDPS